MYVFKKYNGTYQQEQHGNLGQSDSLPITSTLPLRRGRFVSFGLLGSHNQLCTSHTLINLLVTNLFYIHARHRMIEAARGETKNGVLQCAMVSAMISSLAR